MAGAGETSCFGTYRDRCRRSERFYVNVQISWQAQYFGYGGGIWPALISWLCRYCCSWLFKSFNDRGQAKLVAKETGHKLQQTTLATISVTNTAAGLTKSKTLRAAWCQWHSTKASRAFNRTFHSLASFCHFNPTDDLNQRATAVASEDLTKSNLTIQRDMALE